MVETDWIPCGAAGISDIGFLCFLRSGKLKFHFALNQELRPAYQQFFTGLR